MNINERPLEPGFIVQITPEFTDRWGGCLLVVSQVYDWGILGYCLAPGTDQGEQQLDYIRLKQGSYELVGVAAWTVDSTPEGAAWSAGEALQ